MTEGKRKEKENVLREEKERGKRKKILMRNGDLTSFSRGNQVFPKSSLNLRRWNEGAAVVFDSSGRSGPQHGEMGNSLFLFYYPLPFSVGSPPLLLSLSFSLSLSLFLPSPNIDSWIRLFYWIINTPLSLWLMICMAWILAFQSNAACSNVIVLKTCQEVFTHFASDVVLSSATDTPTMHFTRGIALLSMHGLGDYMALEHCLHEKKKRARVERGRKNPSIYPSPWYPSVSSRSDGP